MLKRLMNQYTRTCNIPFYAASLHGLCGVIFVDLIEHTLLVSQSSQSSDGIRTDPPLIPRKEVYCSLSQSLTTSYGKTLRPRSLLRVSPILPLTFGIL